MVRTLWLFLNMPDRRLPGTAGLSKLEMRRPETAILRQKPETA